MPRLEPDQPVTTGVAAQGKLDGLGYVINASRFSTDGYREHSAATREQTFAKITGKPDDDSKLTFVVNGLWQHNTQDPLGLRWSTAQASPRSVEAAALTYNTRKSIDHLQGGVAYERRFGADLFQFSAYAGQRSVIQYQSIPKATQLAYPGHSGGIIDFDRNFYGFKLWQTACATGAKLAWRVKSNLKLPVEQMLPDGSYLSRVFDSDDRARRAGQTVRVIDYALEGSATPAHGSYRLLTNLLDPDAAPALELAALYHERWEIEGVFDEFKTHLRANSTVLRSKTPELVQQELWGLLLAHFAIRQLMAQAAWARELDPDRLSFMHAVRVIKRKMPQAAAVSP